MHRLVISAAAQRDLQTAVDVCVARYPAHYPRFRTTFRQMFAELEEAPLRWAIWRQPDLRSRLVPGYPYRVVYCVTAEHVLVIAVLHQHQDPARRFPEAP